MVTCKMQSDGNMPNFDDARNSVKGLNTMRRRMQSDGNLTYFDDIRNSSDVTVEIQEGSAVQRVNGTFRLAHLLSMISTVDLASLLAVQHFNARSGVVLPHLAETLKACPDLYLTVDMYATISKPKDAVSKLLEILPRNPSLSSPAPIGLVGTGNSASSSALAIVGGVSNLVQCSPSATSPELDERAQHPFFTRVIPTNLGSARAAVEYFKFLGATHVASFHVGDVYGREFAEVFIKEAKEADIDVFSVSFDLGTEQHAKEAVQQLKDSGRRYIFGMFYEVCCGHASVAFSSAYFVASHLPLHCFHYACYRATFSRLLTLRRRPESWAKMAMSGSLGNQVIRLT